jgi:ABC-type uncharacterized transport system permease subunit
MTLIFALGAAIGYGIAAPLLWRGARGGTAVAIAAAAVALHTAALVSEVFHAGNLTLGVTEALSVFSWQAAVLLWALCLVQPLHILGVAIYPLAAIAALWGALWPTSMTAIPLSDWKLQMHVVLSLLGFGLLTIAAVQAVTLAAQDWLLHRHSPTRIVQALPPLQTMESLLFFLISAGFFMLSLAVLSGLLFVDDLPSQHLGHKAILSIIAWAIFGALLWGRWRRGWRGRTALRWALSGYGVLILAYFGSKFILEQILSRHWG